MRTEYTPEELELMNELIIEEPLSDEEMEELFETYNR